MNPRLLSRSILPRLKERLREALWAHRLGRIMRRIEALVFERWQKNVGLLVEFHDRPTRSFACLTRA